MTAPAPASVDQLLAEMVRIPSVNAEVSNEPRAEAVLGDYLERVAQAWGLETRRLPVADRADNLLIWRRNTNASAHEDRPWLLFDSHMDTVSGEGMTIDPFGAVVKNGRLFGRGACDTKGTGAAMLWALRDYAAQPNQPNSIALLFSVDEEAHMTGVRSFIKQDLPALQSQGVRFHGVIVGEPTLHRMVIAHNGLIRWRLATIGRSAHSAAPELGRNAVTMMAKIIAAIETQYIDQLNAEHPLTGRAVCSITMIQGGRQINIIPDRCEIALDRRLTPGENADEVLPAIEHVVASLRTDHPRLQFEQFGVHACPPLDEKISAALRRTVQRTLHERGFDDPPIGAPFATHAGDFCCAGLPAIVLGPGDPTPAHTKDEWVALDEIRKGVEVYRALMNTNWA